MSLFTPGHALLIGVGTYENKKWNAPITVADATGVADALRNPAVSAYPAEQVMLLTDAQATRDGITRALQQFATQVGPDDTALLFFCGHGAPGSDGVYHFATHDATFTADSRIQAGTGLSRDSLLPLLRAIKSRKLLLLINACFSGHLHSGVLGAPPAATFGIDILGTGEGRALITASRPTQYSYYSHAQPRTFFGQALIDGLRGQVTSNGGYIGLYELYQHIYTSVKMAAAGINGTQEPVLTIQQGVGPFPVALAPDVNIVNLNAGAIQQEPPHGTAVEMIDREVVQIQAQGTGAQAFEIRSGSNTVIDQSRKMIDMGPNARIGSFKTGDMAGGDITKIDIKVNATDAAGMDNKADLLKLIAQVQADLIALKDIPGDEREDVTDELRKAEKAGEEGKKERLLDKLDNAQQILLKLGGTIPAALKLGETIGVLIQRAMQL